MGRRDAVTKATIHGNFIHRDMSIMKTTQVAFDVCTNRSRALCAIQNFMYSIMTKAITSQDAPGIIVMNVVGFRVYKVRNTVEALAYLYHCGQRPGLAAVPQKHQ